MLNEKLQQLISVIVPVYNAEMYLHKCINAIIQQTYCNLDIILVDDGSTDQSGQICDEYAAKDKRIRVIHQTNGGASKARNEALKIATGEYFVFVDADDYMDNALIEKLYRMIQENQADIAMCDYEVFRGQEIDKSHLANDIKTVWYKNNEEMIIGMHTVLDELFVVMWGKLFKRELFDNIIFPVGRICEDLAVLYKIYDKAQKTVFTSEKLYYYYRNNENSATYKLNNKFYEDVFTALEEEMTYMNEVHRDLTCYPQKTYMYWLFDYYCKINSSNDVDKKRKLKEVKRKYGMLYKSNKGFKKERFYTVFYYFPKLYIYLKQK